MTVFGSREAMGEALEPVGSGSDAAGASESGLEVAVDASGATISFFVEGTLSWIETGISNWPMDWPPSDFSSGNGGCRKLWLDPDMTKNSAQAEGLSADKDDFGPLVTDYSS